jgi:hypothetical protein
MPDNPSNGSRRFDDLQQRVHRMDDKLDKHSESLAEIKQMLIDRPCVAHAGQLTKHEAALHKLASRQAVSEAGVSVSVAKVTGLAAIVAAAVSAIGAYFMRGG